MSGRASWKSAKSGHFRPFSAFFALFRRVRRAPGKSRKRRKKAFFLSPQICLNPHLLNPHLRHPNSRPRGPKKPEKSPLMILYVLTVLVFGSWVLLLPRLPPSSRSLRLFPWASILLHGPSEICLDLLPAAPLAPVQKQDAQHMFLQHSGKEKAHKHKQIFPVTARAGGGLLIKSLCAVCGSQGT